MYLLDTDHLIFCQRGLSDEADNIRNRMALHDESDFYLSVVSVHEQLMGANNAISRAKDVLAIVRGYRLIEAAMLSYNQFNILPFDQPAADQFNDLRSQRIRIATMDLRIAAIALSNGLTVLTRNAVDFGKVPGLKCEDWTVSGSD